MGRGAEVRTNASGGEVGVESGVGCCSSGPRCGAGLAQLPPSLQREGLALRVPGEQVPLASGAAGLGAHLTRQADRKSTRLNPSHTLASRMPSSA